MYICICNSVTDTDIRESVAGGVRNLRQLQAETGCGTGCGCCIESAREELADALPEKRQFLRMVPAPVAA